MSQEDKCKPGVFDIRETFDQLHLMFDLASLINSVLLRAKRCHWWDELVVPARSITYFSNSASDPPSFRMTCVLSSDC